MTTAEIISIGTELLLGDVLDTNTNFLARQFRQLGVDLFRTTTIGDNPARIAEQVKRSLDCSDFVITTGGLGPTVDDPTREAISLAFNQPLVFHPELWEIIQSRFLSIGFTPTRNNQRQAYLPNGAFVIENPVGTAPAFWISQGKKIVISLPGVPDEMKAIFHESVIPLLSERNNLNEILRSRLLHVCCMGESSIDDLISDYEKLANPTVGLCAKPGIVDIRIAAKSTTTSQAEAMILKVESEIRELIPGLIFGVDDTTLQDALMSQCLILNLHPEVYSYGIPIEELSPPGSTLSGVFNLQPVSSIITENEFADEVKALPAFLIIFQEYTSPPLLDLYYKTVDNRYHIQRSYLGPKTQARNWAVNFALGNIWKAIDQIYLEKK